MSEAVVVQEAWLASWLSWPRASVPVALLDEAADWAASSLLCECSHEWFSGLSVEERRGFVGLVAELVRAGLARAVPVGAGKRVVLLVESCWSGGRPCGRARVVRVEVHV